MTTFYVSPSGSAANTGAIGSPWTLAFACSGASGTIHAGDTILLRGGAYNLVTGFTISVSGSVSLPITFAAYVDESPVIDGCYQEFVTSPTTAWTPYDLVGHNVYRSTGTYTSTITRDGCGHMTMGGKLRTLLPHPNGLTYITSDVQDYVYPTPAPRYMGYGFAWNPVATGGDDKIYIRLDTPDAGSMLAADAADGLGFHNGYPVLADPDPRHYPISLFPCDQNGVTLTGNYITFGAGIVVKNYNTAAKILGVGCKISGGEYQYGAIGIRCGTTSSSWVIDGAYINAAMPSETSWFAWTDVKGGETPAQRVRKNAIFLDTTHNGEIKNCIIREAFDGILAGSGNDFYVHDNLFDNVWDDAWQILGSLYRIEFARNICYGAGISHDAAGSNAPNGSPGTQWIHHNIFDTTKYLVWWGRRGRDNVGQGNTGDEGLLQSEALGTHGVPTAYSEPWKFYYNTIVMDKWSQNPYVDIAEFGRTATHHEAPHEVFNNIIVTAKQLGNHFDSATGNQIYDGNVYYYAVYHSLHWRFITTSTGLLPVSGEPTGLLDTIAQMQATQAFPDSKVYYAPGWEASGLDINPQLDANYAPHETTVQIGAVDITGKGWPGAVVYEAQRGAIQAPVPVDPAPSSGSSEGWWGPQSATEQIFPFVPPPPLGYVPPVPVPQGGSPPRFVQFVYDNGYISYIVNT